MKSMLTSVVAALLLALPATAAGAQEAPAAFDAYATARSLAVNIGDGQLDAVIGATRAGAESAAPATDRCDGSSVACAEASPLRTSADAADAGSTAVASAPGDPGPNTVSGAAITPSAGLSVTLLGDATAQASETPSARGEADAASLSVEDVLGDVTDPGTLDPALLPALNDAGLEVEVTGEADATSTMSDVTASAGTTTATADAGDVTLTLLPSGTTDLLDIDLLRIEVTDVTATASTDGTTGTASAAGNVLRVFLLDEEVEIAAGAGPLDVGGLVDVSLSEPVTAVDGANARAESPSVTLRFGGEPGVTISLGGAVAEVASQGDQNLTTACIAADTATPGEGSIQRVSGSGRIDTAVNNSGCAFPDGADIAVLARADVYADALSGATVAAQRNGPMLLTDSDRLVEQTRAEIERLDPTTVILLGGLVALDANVESQVRALGVDIERYGGANRFDTANLIAEELGDTSGTAFVVEGEHSDASRGWPDAVSAAPYAAFAGQPILLVNARRLPAETVAALERQQVSDVVIVGGPAAVSAGVEDELMAEGFATRRIFGGNRYETSAAVYAEGVGAGMDPSMVYLATGANWPDALTSGPAVASLGATFLLTDGSDLSGSPATRQALESNADAIGIVRLVGGENTISATVEGQVRAILGR